MLRVFLKDGTSLVSYGEPARVGDRVVFSMPMSAFSNGTVPPLHLVNLATERVDWERTERYSESVRAARYLSTRAAADYAQLTDDVARALNAVASTPDPGRRLPVVERARKTLVEWPAWHYNYKQADIRQMLAILDEAIADLRAAAGAGQFDLSFVASVNRPIEFEPILPPPTLSELIAQTLSLAKLSDMASDRVSLLTVVLGEVERHREALPTAFYAAHHTEASALLATETALTKTYQDMTARFLARASRRARAADVRGVERVLADIRLADEEAGRRRPDEVLALVTTVEAELASARQLRLERDRWLLRQAEYRRYRTIIDMPLTLLEGVAPALEDIKSLAGSGPEALAAVERTAARVLKLVATVVPPVELVAAHELFVSAVHLTDNAARIRREATLSTDLTRAWDASSAAAAALMLAARARTELDAMLRLPQMPR